MKLKYLTYDQIDKQKWDICIGHAGNSLIYAYSFYLDAMAAQWDAIVINDYEGVLPLPWKKKWGIKYFYTPPFTPQLGLFADKDYTITPEILELIHSKAKYGDLFFNYENMLPSITSQHVNYIINLHQPYTDIFNNYKKDLKNNLKKAAKEQFIYSKKEEIQLAINLYKKYYSARIPHVSNDDFDRFYSLCKLLAEKKMAFTRSVLNNTHEVLSIGLFLFDGKRIYNIMNTTTTEGKQKESNPFLLDCVIQEFADREIIFDFEGSDIKGVKSFYEKFNPTNEHYFFYHFNHLPGLLKLIKK